MGAYTIKASYLDLFFKAEKFLGDLFASSKARLAKSRPGHLASWEIPGTIRIFRAPTSFSYAQYTVFPNSESTETGSILGNVRTFLGELQKESQERDRSGFLDKIFQNP